MMRKLTVVSMLLLALVAFTAMVFAQEEKAAAKEEAKFEYVGSDKCKICHKPEFTAWEATGHANTWDDLSAEEQKKPECITCHMTGQTADGEVLTSVGCEACHGPGSAYKSPKIMSKKGWPADPEGSKKAAIEAGLIYPTAENCMRCHKEEGNPNFKPFDFEKMKGLVHPVATE